MKKINWHLLIISILTPLLFGGIVGFLTKDYIDYSNLIKPSFAPVSWVFPVMWSILYILMGISYYLIFISNSPNKQQVFNIYKIQLIVNYFWSIIFFVFKLRGLAFLWILLLISLVVIMIIRFYKINKTAAYIQIPYLLWLLYAAILNITIYMMN